MDENLVTWRNVADERDIHLFETGLSADQRWGEHTIRRDNHPSWPAFIGTCDAYLTVTGGRAGRFGVPRAFIPFIRCSRDTFSAMPPGPFGGTTRPSTAATIKAPASIRSEVNVMTRIVAGTTDIYSWRGAFGPLGDQAFAPHGLNDARCLSGVNRGQSVSCMSDHEVTHRQTGQKVEENPAANASEIGPSRSHAALVPDLGDPPRNRETHAHPFPQPRISQPSAAPGEPASSA
jgi:hypothetical protein